jgi:cell wall-associated NlpC family hydrolase
VIITLRRFGSRSLCGLFAVALLATGCSSDPVIDTPTRDSAVQASTVAASMVGKPYRYGGHSPRGFDCSGLVYYSYQRAGLTVPRSTESLRQATHKIAVSRLTLGDLLFFNQDGKFSSHVAIYLGHDRFVHAPSHGKQVRVDYFSDDYWQRHFVDARRL